MACVTGVIWSLSICCFTAPQPLKTTPALPLNNPPTTPPQPPNNPPNNPPTTPNKSPTTPPQQPHHNPPTTPPQPPYNPPPTNPPQPLTIPPPPTTPPTTPQQPPHNPSTNPPKPPHNPRTTPPQPPPPPQPPHNPPTTPPQTSQPPHNHVHDALATRRTERGNGQAEGCSVPLSGKRPCEWTSQGPKATVGERPLTAGVGGPLGRTWPTANAVAFLRVDSTRSSETGKVRGLRWHNRPKERKGKEW